MKRFVLVLLVLLLTACGGSNAVPATETPLVLASPTAEVSTATAVATEDLRLEWALEEALDAIATQQAGSDQLSAQLTAIAEMPTPTPVVVVVAPTATPLSADDCPYWGYIIANTKIYEKRAEKNNPDKIRLNRQGNPFTKKVNALGFLYKGDKLCVYSIQQFDAHRVYKLYFARVDENGKLRGAYSDWKWCCYIPVWSWLNEEAYEALQNED